MENSKTDIEAFLHYLNTQKISVHTRRAYHADVDDFAEYCETVGIVCAAADAATVQSYYAALHVRGLTPATCARRVSSLRKLFAFLLQKGCITTNPAMAVNMPARHKKLAVTLSADEVAALLRDESDEDDPRRERDNAMVCLFVDCGLLISECVALDVHSVDLAAHKAYIQGSRARTVSFDRSVRDAIDQWIIVRESLVLYDADAQPALFLSRLGKRLSIRSCARALERRGVSQRMLRGSYAAALLEAGTPIPEAQKLLGLANAGSARRYVP